MIPLPRLLVTRFSPHAEQLAGALREAGYFALAQPLLGIKPTQDHKQLKKFIDGDFDIVIAVSGNAVTYTHQMLQQVWPAAIYLAVGASTQAALNKQVQGAVITPTTHFDSEGLLALDVLQHVQGKQILILRGQGGRDLLDKTLIERGARVEFLESYKRVALPIDGNQLRNNCQQADINGAIISSIEILNQLFTLVTNQHKNWLNTLTFYVPSERVAEYGASLGLKRLVVLPSLQADKIITFFKENNGNPVGFN